MVDHTMNSELCNKPVRGGGKCKLNEGHRGHHSTVTFFCDGHQRMVRGKPYATTPDGEFADGMHYCFPCVKGNHWRF